MNFQQETGAEVCFCDLIKCTDKIGNIDRDRKNGRIRPLSVKTAATSNLSLKLSVISYAAPCRH